MKKTLFEYQDYKKYVSDTFAAWPSKGHGERSRLATVLKCHPAYVSQVLNGAADFSLEQAEALNRHLGHSEEESDFFIALVSLARAGTPPLRKYYDQKLQKMIEHRSVLKNRLEFKKALQPADQSKYYSAWYYAAIHLLVGIPEFQTKERLAMTLDLPITRVVHVLEFLEGAGLVARDGPRFCAGTVSVHLGNDSDMIAKHHTNWRMQAIRSLDRDVGEELHYSSAVTISKADVPKIKSIIIAAIEQIREVVRPSHEENLYCYTMDFFKVRG